MSLSKLVIKAYSAKDRRSVVGEWAAQINPEGYRQAYRTLVAEDRGIDTGGTVIRYRAQKPQDLNFRFTVDGTGVVPGVTDVDKHVRDLRDLAFTYEGQYHSPNLLDVLWGKLVFRCMLISMEVDYTLFAPDGAPLRAEISAAFRQHRTPQEVAETASKRSADLTHERRMVAGLPLTHHAHEIYRDPGFYVDVARANDHDDLTPLPPGSAVVFPKMVE